MNNLANCLSILSLVCGFFSIIFSLENHFTFASWAIILSVVFDGLDGELARKNRIPSDFGKELDSLVDVVSFGLAPTILGYRFIYQKFHLWSTLTLLVYLFCGVWRLARYNVTPKEKLALYFYGLPTTASGGVLASFILIFRRGYTFNFPEYVPIVFLLLVLTLSFLMVSRLKYLNLDGLKNLFGKKINIVMLALVPLLVIEAFSRKMGVTLFSLFLIYLIFSPFVVKRINHH